MTKLCILDLDKTLIPYDSFNRYLKYLVKHGSIGVGWLIGLRVCRVISAKSFKRKVFDFVEKSSKLQSLSQRFAYTLKDDIIWPQYLTDILSSGANDVSVVIISASPDCYLKWLKLSVEIDELNIPVSIVGSHYIDGQFVEMYGEEKLKYINKNFTPDKYKYYYAISDSQSDLCWMKLFDTYEIKKMQ